MLFLNQNIKSPEIYHQKGKDYYLDPVRKKLVSVTPEETIRQEMLAFLLAFVGVPLEMLAVEEHLSHYGVDSYRRADIIIHAIDADTGQKYPVCIIECKAAGTSLDKDAHNQVFEYCDLIGADYAVLCNGSELFCYYYQLEAEEYIRLAEMPDYSQMLQNIFEPYDFGIFPERTPFEKLSEVLQNEFKMLDDPLDAYYISPKTDLKIAVPAFNLLECFLDYRVKMPVGDYGMFELLEDQGILKASYGDAGGGGSDDYYRSFLIKINDRIESVSFAISAFGTCAHPDVIHTVLNIAIDNEQESKSHHAVQIVLDNNDHNMEVIRDTCHFYHSGKITVGNIGRGVKADLREFVRKKCPELIDKDRFYFGSLVHDRLWCLDDPKVIKIIRNMICYAEIADEYREHRKRTYKKKS